MTIWKGVIDLFRVPEKHLTYSTAPVDPTAYTNKMNHMYTTVAKAYDGFMVVFPLWKKWLGSVLPYINGKRVLEVSFGPGYLLTQYPKNMRVYGLDYNRYMVYRAKVKVRSANRKAKLVEGNVEDMPYPDNFFDTVVNTMAFTGYPNGNKAMNEMLRVLKPGGQLLILDYDFPTDRNIAGYAFVKFIELCGDIIKDIGQLVIHNGAVYERKIIGGFGSIQLFIIQKPSQ